MRPVRTPSLLIALLIPLVSFAARPVRADEPVKPGKALADRCQKLSNEGDYRAALEACEQAYALNPEPGLLVYIAQIQTALLHPVQAHEALTRYLAGQPDDAHRKMADNQLHYLETLIATVSVSTRLEGAQISIDDQVLEPSALVRGVRLIAGAHRITIEANGKTFTRFVFLRAGERTQLELPDEQQVQPRPNDRASALDAPPPAAPSARSSMNPRGYWVVAAGTAFGGAAIATGVYNGSEYDRWHAANERLAKDELSLSDAANRAAQNNHLMDDIKTGRKVAIGLGIAGGLLTVGGVVLLLVDSAAAERNHTSSWFGRLAAGLTVNGAKGSGGITWQSSW